MHRTLNRIHRGVSPVSIVRWQTGCESDRVLSGDLGYE